MNPRVRSRLFRCATIVAWIYCGLVGIGMADMLITYSQPGRGVASPWGKLDAQDLWLNGLLWVGPAIFFLLVLHSRATKSWFLKDSRKNNDRAK